MKVCKYCNRPNMGISKEGACVFCLQTYYFAKNNPVIMNKIMVDIELSKKNLQISNITKESTNKDIDS